MALQRAVKPRCIGSASRLLQTAVRLVTTGIILTLLAGIAIRLKVFGNGG